MKPGTLLGFCTTCFRVRWLHSVNYTDDRGNSHGTCTQCAREAEQDGDEEEIWNGVERRAKERVAAAVGLR